MICKIWRSIITKCNGCGVTLQSANNSKPGYIPESKLKLHQSARNNYQLSLNKLISSQTNLQGDMKHSQPDNIEENEKLLEADIITKDEIEQHKKIIKMRNIYCARCIRFRAQPAIAATSKEAAQTKLIDTKVAINAIFDNIKSHSVILYVMVYILQGYH
jgi:hypothetical protein